LTTAEAAEDDGKETAAAMTVVAMAASSSSSYTVTYGSGVRKVEAAGPEAEGRGEE
jgi:hypothetical protein